MRLNQLDLIRYGKFTNFSLSFGQKPDDGPDFHVVYGPNEAGKSTMLSAWLELLFGIPHQSPMSFLHDGPTMQLGADLEIGGYSHQVLRVKKTKNTLLDGHGTPIGETLLQGGLRGLDDAAYKAMFSIDGPTLAQGGESILSNQGELGRMLFSASAGLADLGGRLDEFRQGTDAFLSPTGRKGHLLELKREFTDLGSRMKELDTAAGEFTQLIKARDAARTLWQTAQDLEKEAITRSIKLQSQIAALPIASRLARLNDKIAEYGDLPNAPADWVKKLPTQDRMQTEMATRLDTATKQVLGLEEDLERQSPEAVILKLSEGITAVGRLKPGHDTALDDLPNRIRERDAETGAINACLARLGQTKAAPETLVPKAAVLGTLQGLIEKRSGVETALLNAQQELEDAQEADQIAARQLTQAGGDITGIGGLTGLVSKLRRDNPEGALDQAKTAKDTAQYRLGNLIVDLKPWTGNAADLIAIERPDAQWIGATQKGLAAAERNSEQLGKDVARAHEELSQTQSRLAAVGVADAITLEQAAKVRAGREQLWMRHRSALNTDTADAFEQAMRLDDQVSTTLADQRTQTAKTTEQRALQAEYRQKLETAEMRAEHARTHLEEQRKALADRIAQVSDVFPPGMSIEAFGKWLERCKAAQEAVQTVAEAELRCSRKLEILNRHRGDLLAAMALAGRTLDATTGISVVAETAQTLLDSAAKITGLRATATEAKRAAERREKAFEKAQKTEARWQADWKSACLETWMAESPPDVPEMRAILGVLAELQEHLRKHDDKDLRVGQMTDNRDRFVAGVAGIAKLLDLPTDGAATDIWARITKRLRAAEDAETTQNQTQKKLKTAREQLAKLNDDVTLNRQWIDEIRTFFDKPDWPEARNALTRAGERDGLLLQRDDCTEELCTLLQIATAKEALELLDGLDPSVLQAEAQTLKAERDMLREKQQEAHAAYMESTRLVAAVGGDNSVARLAEQRQTLLAEMEDGARTHLRKRLGVLAVDQALRRYRDTHRSGMMERASEAFRVMSQNQYTGLTAQPDGAREILVALASEGGSKQAAQLSDGTRAQLYLALRIAGYHEFVDNKGPVPFIADDIMESFDDERTAEALGLLAKMSNAGQVIYLTHHAHVCETAKRVCPRVQIHAL
ncbi:MAG: AAA family ATPase [Rhodobacteraceae bacterium]|nr:AAA family ATPase [Paracoccaceae bacterium]